MHVPSDWWKDFFRGATLDVWRAVMTGDQTRAEADFIEKRLAISPPAKVLDVACGAGRLALELASRGYEATGVDLSGEFLEEGKAQAAARGLEVQWEHRDMRDLPWRNEFDAAFSFGNGFGYLDDEGDREFLAAVSRALKLGGRLGLDTKSAETVFPNFQERQWFELGEITFLMEDSYDPARGRVDSEYTFITKGRVEKKRGSERVYSYRELSRLFEEAGLDILKAFGSLQCEPFRLGSIRLLLVLERKDDHTRR